MRIGQGYDVHRLVSGRPLVLGGVTVPHDKGLDGHSDADVLLHAICDALLGAAALGDIGKHFPDTDERYAGADSRVLLRAVVALLAENHFQVVNIDSTIIAEKPKLAPFIDAMRQNIAADLRLANSSLSNSSLSNNSSRNNSPSNISTDVSNVSVKATTTEKLGFAGQGQGIAAQAVVLIEKLPE